MNDADTTVTVIGSSNQDYIVHVPARPSAGETTLATTLLKQPGGKGANQAVAAARMGARVEFVGAVGDDNDGALLLRELRAEGVDTSDVEIVQTAPTGLALVTVDPTGENSIVVVPGANYAITARRVSRVIARKDPSGVVVLQGEIAPAVVAAAIEAAESRGLRCVLNLAPAIEVPGSIASIDPLVVNESEAAALLGATVSAATAADAVAQLASRARSAVLTLGAAGAVWSDGERCGRVAAPTVAEVVDTTGAGDAFVGVLAASLAKGMTLAEAVEWGVEAGSFAVTREGAQSSYAMASELESRAGTRDSAARLA